LKNKKSNSEDKKQLIHYTSDGFYGYNSSNLENYAIVRSFNGLLISDDLIESSECNYGNYYADYNHIYKTHIKNPDKLIKLSKDEIEKLKTQLKKQKSKIKIVSENIFEKEEIDTSEINTNNFDKEQYKLYKKNLSHLSKQQEKDKNIILNSGIYDKNLIEDAQHEALDMSPSLIRALDEHYKFKRIA